MATEGSNTLASVDSTNTTPNMRPISPVYICSALEYLETSCHRLSLCRSYTASGEHMHIKCGCLVLPLSPVVNWRALFFLRVLTALRISVVVSLSAGVSARREVLPFANCTVLPSFMALRVTHSSTVPSCSPKSSALSFMASSNAVASKRSDISTYAPYCVTVASTCVWLNAWEAGVTPSVSPAMAMDGSNSSQRLNSTVLPPFLGMGRFWPYLACTNLVRACATSLRS